MNSLPENPKPPSRRTALLALACLFAAFVAFVSISSERLPDRVATHFNAAGKANGWMTRAQHVKFTIGVGIGTPVFILGVFAMVTKLKGLGLNIPHKAYWLAPEREQATFDFLRAHGYWLAALLVAFHAGLFESIVIANSRTPPVLTSTSFFVLVGAFLTLVLVWVAVILARFRRPAA